MPFREERLKANAKMLQFYLTQAQIKKFNIFTQFIESNGSPSDLTLLLVSITNFNHPLLKIVMLHRFLSLTSSDIYMVFRLGSPLACLKTISQALSKNIQLCRKLQLDWGSWQTIYARRAFRDASNRMNKSLTISLEPY